MPLIAKAIELAIDFIKSRFDQDRLIVMALEIVLPQLVQLLDLDELEVNARLHVQATVDDLLRQANL